MSIPTLKIKPYKTHRFVLDLRALGQGRKFFSSRDEARAARLRALTLFAKQGREAAGLSARALAEVMDVRARLAVHKATLSQAADFFIKHQENTLRCHVTIKELTAEVIEAKKRDGKAKRTIASLRGYLGQFCRVFGERLVSTVTSNELDTWLRDLPLSPKSRQNFRNHVGVLFSYAKQRKMITENPIESTDKVKLVDKPPGILTVDQAMALLEAAQQSEPAIVPMLAIAMFAGLRTSEVHRLDWSDVKLSQGFIEVSAAKSKSARRRLIPIQPCLALWLNPYASMSGRVVPEDYKGAVSRVRKEAGISTWPHNACRHSYASYQIALTNDAAATAAALGHSTTALLYSTYRLLVSQEEAKRYFAIVPQAKAVNVVSFAAAPQG